MIAAAASGEMLGLCPLKLPRLHVPPPAPLGLPTIVLRKKVRLSSSIPTCLLVVVVAKFLFFFFWGPSPWVRPYIVAADRHTHTPLAVAELMSPHMPRLASNIVAFFPLHRPICTLHAASKGASDVDAVFSPATWPNVAMLQTLNLVRR